MNKNELFLQYYTACSKTALKKAINKNYELCCEQREDILQESYLYFFNSIRNKNNNVYKIYLYILDRIEHEYLKDKEYYNGLAYISRMANSWVVLWLRKILWIKQPDYIKDLDTWKYILKSVFWKEKELWRKLTQSEKAELKENDDNMKIHYTSFNEYTENIEQPGENINEEQLSNLDLFYNRFKDILNQFLNEENVSVNDILSNKKFKLNRMFYKKLCKFIIKQDKHIIYKIDDEIIQSVFENLCLYWKECNEDFLSTKIFNDFKKIFNY